MQRFFAVLRARNIEFYRDKSSLSWNLLFPAMLLFGFAFLFSEENQNQYKVGVVTTDSEMSEIGSVFLKHQYIEFLAYPNSSVVEKKIDHHQLDLAIDFTLSRYWLNESSVNGYFVEQLLLAEHPELEKSQINGRPVRYVDWVLPGVLGMNLMFSSLFGVGYVIVRYRKNGVLKRLQATPLSALEFISAQVASRLLILITINVFLFTGCNYLLDFYIKGSLLDLFIVLTLGAISLISLGLMVASRSASEEFTGGLLNFASWPMMFLSGVWFSLEGSPEIFRFAAQLLPLTHLVDGARAILTEGATLSDISYNLFCLVGMSATFLTISAWLFKWGTTR